MGTDFGKALNPHSKLWGILESNKIVAKFPTWRLIKL
jgi:hypothetical protein